MTKDKHLQHLLLEDLQVYSLLSQDLSPVVHSRDP